MKNDLVGADANNSLGVIYYVKANGENKILLDTRDQKINTADIAWDAQKKILYVPTFFKNKVMAYKLL